jgi:hypothetical protein
MIARLAPCVLVFAPLPALAEVCERDRLDLPEPIAGAVRPYVQCGMFAHAESDTPVIVNGTAVSINGALIPSGPAACAGIRARAALEADQDLQATMPDRAARERYVESVLQDADRFIAAAYTADAIGIDPAEQRAACRTDETRTSHASDH